MTTPNIKNILITTLSFLLYFIAFKYFREVRDSVLFLVPNGLAAYFIAYTLVGIPIFTGTCILNKSINPFRYLGLNGQLGRGFLLAFIFASPMLLGGLLMYPLQAVTNIPQLIAGTLFAGLFEELYFRGFLFGQLYRKTGLGFIMSIVFGALVFASGHLYQSTDPLTLLGVFLTTFLGAILFAWLYAEWNFNIWVPVFLHTFMNLAWSVFGMGADAGGNARSNMLRILTIAASIIITIAFKRYHKQELAVNRRTLLLQK